MSNTTFSPESVEAFQSSLAQASGDWLAAIPSYDNEAGSQAVYDQMGVELLDRTLNTPDLAAEFSMPSVTAGMEIFPRFMYAGAAKAALLGYGLSELRQGMYKGESFNSLILITKEPKSVAKRIEIPLGLKKLVHCDIDPNINLYDFSPEAGLTVGKYIFHRNMARRDAYAQELIEEEGLTAENPSFCVGQNTGINRHIYHHMLSICMTDPNLFQATLLRNRSST